MAKLTLSFKGKVLKVYPLPEGEILIGSDPSCDIHVDSLAISPRHARLLNHSQEIRLEDLEGSGGLWVNQVKISTHTLSHGDRVQIGKHTLIYSDDAPPATQSEPVAPPATPAAAAQTPPHAQPAHATGWLQILNGPNLGRTLPLNSALTRVGKEGRQSAIIARRGDGYYLSALEGDELPRVDGLSIGQGSKRLDEGNIIQVGDTKMQFFINEH